MKNVLLLSALLPFGLLAKVQGQENKTSDTTSDTRTGYFNSTRITDPAAEATITGTGKMVSVSFKEAGFKDIEVTSEINVVLKQAPEYSVKVFAEEHIADLVRVEKRGESLVVGLKLNTSIYAKGITVYITAPDLRGIVSKGAGKITSEGAITTKEFLLRREGAGDTDLELNAESVMVVSTGAGEIKLKGKAPNFLLTLSGVTIARCFDLKTQHAKIGMSGLAKADVSVSQSLRVKADNMVVLRYKGSPKVEQRVSGEGSITKVE